MQKHEKKLHVQHNNEVLWFFFFQIESPTDVFYDSAEHLDLQMSAKKVELVW